MACVCVRGVALGWHCVSASGDALLAWGDETAIRARLQAHWDAGADQVAVQVMPNGGGLLTAADERVLELLAPTR